MDLHNVSAEERQATYKLLRIYVTRDDPEAEVVRSNVRRIMRRGWPSRVYEWIVRKSNWLPIVLLVYGVGDVHDGDSWIGYILIGLGALAWIVFYRMGAHERSKVLPDERFQ